MAKFGDYVAYDGLIYRIVAVSADAEPTYTLEPVRRSEKTLTRTVPSSQKQVDLIPGGGDNISGVALGSLTPVGSRTATASALADGKVRVKFESNGGTPVAYQVIDEGGKAIAPIAPTRTHYTFAGWYIDNGTFADAVVFASIRFDEDTTLYAKWTAITYTVAYNSNGGSAVAPETVNSGEAADEPVAPTKAGYIFGGWFTDNTTFENEYDFATLVVADITLYAKWLEAVTVTFDSNEGSAVPAQVIVKGTKATEPEAPTLEGNTFAGWFYDDVTFADPVDFEVDVFNADDTLYAKWTLAG
jgi:uncharacterized repeat protein (TIGR02543 family)